MTFFKQTLALTITGLSGIPQRRGSSFVTVISVTTVVAVLLSLLAIGEGAQIFTGRSTPPNQAVVMSRGATNPAQSAITRDALAIISDAPGIKREADGTPWVVATSFASVDAIKKDGKRGNFYLVGFSPGVDVAQTNVKIIKGRKFRPAVRELNVSEPIYKQYRGMEIGDTINLRGTVWTIVGIFAGSDTIGDSVLRADADTVMSAFARTAYQQVTVTLNSKEAFKTFKDALTSNPAIQVEVKTGEENMKQNFGQLNTLLDFVAYFVGTVMASGAVFGALNSLYASVDARRREIATLRAIGFSSGPIIVSVLLEGMTLALPGAFIGAAIATLAFNGNVVDVQGLIFKLTVTPHLLLISVFWALAIGLIGGSLPAMRAARLPVATALRAT